MQYVIAHRIRIATFHSINPALQNRRCESPFHRIANFHRMHLSSHRSSHPTDAMNRISLIASRNPASALVSLHFDPLMRCILLVPPKPFTLSKALFPVLNIIFPASYYTIASTIASLLRYVPCVGFFLHRSSHSSPMPIIALHS